MRWGMVINLAKCMRCHACVAACRIEHFLPLDITWVKLIAYEVDEDGVVDVSTYPVRCNQCADAPCVHACPTEASHQREDGIVVIDSDKCIGCRYCVIACPYQNRTFFSKDKDPGYFPGYERTRFEKMGQKLYPHQRGHHREVQLLRRAHRRRHVARPHARRRPRRHAGVRQHLPGAGAHVRRPRRPGQQRVAGSSATASGFQLRAEYGTDPSVWYIDYRLGGAPSNKAPREAQTGSHIQHLSTVDRDAYRRIYGTRAGRRGGEVVKAQTRRQWITTHEWMVKPMRQKEWISGKGILVWLAEVFSALGMGTYLVGLLAGVGEITTWAWWATVLGWVLIVLFKLPLHLVYLGRPLRFWRAIPPFTKAWKTSWLARGMFFSIVFTGTGFLQIVFWYFLHWGDLSASAADALTVLSWIVGIVAGVFIVLTGVYCGFAMSYCKSLPFWNTGLLPIVFVIMGVADGLALTMGVNLLTGADEAAISTLEFWSRILLVVNALLIAGYLVRAYQQALGRRARRAGPHQGQHGVGLLDPARDPRHRHPAGHLDRHGVHGGRHRASAHRGDRLPHDRRVRAEVLRPQGRHLPVRPSRGRLRRPPGLSGKGDNG